MIWVYKCDEAIKLKEYIGEELYSHRDSKRHECTLVENRGYYISFSYIDIRNPHKKAESVSIYCDENNLICVTDCKICIEYLKNHKDEKDCFSVLTKMVFNLTDSDIDRLECIENDIDQVEMGILNAHKPVNGVSARIIELRRSLLKIKTYYDQLGIVIERISENENEIISKKTMLKYTALCRQINYLTQFVMHLRETVTQVREAYQAQIDIEQNYIMKILTVITAIFLPLSLIVGWYGMNVIMPEYNWKFGYAYVASLSICVIILCIFIFKKKKWF